MFDLELIKKTYETLAPKLERIRKIIKSPLTATEKILYAHTNLEQLEKAFERGRAYADFFPDRVAMQDATAQMAILQFMQAGRKTSAVPATIHADHLIQAQVDAATDLAKAKITNKEVYDFLASASNKYGLGFWKPGAGIIHQVLLENYAFPGGLMIGSDSHTVNAGGLGMIAIGVGGADIVDVMVGLPWELLFPKLVGVKLTGKLNGWTSAKDIILKVAGLLTVKGGTGKIVEYFGSGAEELSATGKGTIANMGAEIGATTSLFGYDQKMAEYLAGTGREAVARLAEGVKEHLTADPEVYEQAEQYFDECIEIDLSTLEPHINGPFTPDRATPISKFKDAVRENNWPEKLEVGLIGSCTNSSYEDISRSASIAKQAALKNLKAKAEFTITPGSEQVRYTVERDGFLADFAKINGVVLANACGPCIGQWARHSEDPNRKNSIITSFNRNFAKRNDGNPNTHSFVASPEIVTALTIAGSLSFNPLEDTLINENGEAVKLEAPRGSELPPTGFEVEDNGYQAPAAPGEQVEVIVAPTSKRLQLLKPFASNTPSHFTRLRLLIKVKGKCTTDHISMAGPWLKFRGHLDNISNNLLTGATNAFNNRINCITHVETGAEGPIPATQRDYQKRGIGTMVVGDENYGEGSSREHAAMQPRHLGVRVVLVKSFARIHETNLKKQGMLALTFKHPADYDKIQEKDVFTVVGLENFSIASRLKIKLQHEDGAEEMIEVNHSYNQKQIEWFKAGSALNLIRQREAGR